MKHALLTLIVAATPAVALAQPAVEEPVPQDVAADAEREAGMLAAAADLIGEYAAGLDDKGFGETAEAVRELHATVVAAKEAGLLPEPTPDAQRYVEPGVEAIWQGQRLLYGDLGIIADAHADAAEPELKALADAARAAVAAREAHGPAASPMQSGEAERRMAQLRQRVAPAATIFSAIAEALADRPEIAAAFENLAETVQGAADSGIVEPGNAEIMERVQQVADREAERVNDDPSSVLSELDTMRLDLPDLAVMAREQGDDALADVLDELAAEAKVAAVALRSAG